MTELRDAVDDLTLPKRVKVMQDEEVVTVMVPPLLHQLDEATRSSLGVSEGSATLKSATSLTNDAALTKLMQISDQVRAWLRGLDPKDADIARNTSAALRLWYVAALGANLEDSTYHINTLRAWAGQIRGLLDPPRTLELPDNCPDCGADKWWDASEPSKDGRSYPLVVVYRRDDPVKGATAKCRACDRSWTARELAYELEHTKAV